MAYMYPATHTQDKRHSSQMVEMYTAYDKEAQHLTVPSKSKKSSDSSSSSVFSNSSFSSKRQLLKSKLSSSDSSSKRSSKKSEKEYLDHTAFNHIWNR